MDCLCGKEHPSPCHPVFPAVPYDRPECNGGQAGIPSGRNRRKVSGKCICGELLSERYISTLKESSIKKGARDFLRALYKKRGNHEQSI